MKLSVDDGCASDLRVAQLARRYNIETIFYFPVYWKHLAFLTGYEPLSTEEAFDIGDDFEIGSHTLTHPHLTKIPLEDAKYEIYQSKIDLEQLFGQKITKFCPPRGYTNKELTEFTLEHYEEQRLTRQPGLVHIHPNSGANKNEHWLDCVKEDTVELWCHSWELDKYNLWDEVEAFFEGLHS